MTKKNRQIRFAIIEFALILLGLGIAALLNDVTGRPQIHSVKIKGNRYLSAETYKKFANLQDKKALENIELQTIMDRLNKHPYVKFVDVYFSGKNTCTAIVHEKSFTSILLYNNRQFLLDDNLSIEPLLPFTNNIDLPVIENLKTKEKRITSKNKDLLTAKKILYSVKLLNGDLFSEISEIDMAHGGDIIVRFTDYDFQLILGRGNEVRKMVYFNAVYNRMRKINDTRIIDYIDLRFEEQICFGFKPKLFSYLEKQS